MLNKIKLSYKRWVVFAKKVAVVQTKAVFFIAYYLFVMPFGMFVRMFVDFPKAGWHKAGMPDKTLDEAKRQF